VDDNRLLAHAIERRFSLESALRWAGWVGDPQHAVQDIKRANADVVLVDIDMPGRDGFSVVRELAESLPHVRAIMFSGHVSPEYIDKAFEAGAWGYVSKAEPIEQLLAAISGVMNGEFVLSPQVSAVRLAGA